MPDPITIQVNGIDAVSGLMQTPKHPVACYVMAHGAGAGMTHTFMSAAADGLVERGVAVLRFQFPFMENGSKRPDRPTLVHATIRAAVRMAVGLRPDLPLFAGGKSFGARMTSQTQAEAPLPAVQGLIFFGFPLHPAGRPSDDRAEHLTAVDVPMLFVQGTRDALARTQLLVPMVDALGPTVTLKLIDHADHGFHVPVRSGRSDTEALAESLDVVATWIQRTTRTA